MAPARRNGAHDSETRTALLDAAEHLMLEEGYAAVTSRRVAQGQDFFLPREAQATAPKPSSIIA